MSFLKRVLASVGIGSARVDTVLDTHTTQPGGTLAGTVHVHGGDTPQKIEHIYLALMTQYTKEVDDKKHHVAHALSEVRLRESFEVKAGDALQLPFRLDVPWGTPVSVGRSRVWVKTGLSVSMAVDPKDDDAVQVEPTPAMRTVLEAVQGLGFSLLHADNEASRLRGRALPFVQEFEFRPTGRYAGRLQELEIILDPSPSGVRVLLEADLRARGLLGALMSEMDMNERFAQLEFSDSELQRGVEPVQSAIARTIEGRLQR